jgi:solute carrier family 25 thiamine pyrophosphate transporter 19
MAGDSEERELSTFEYSEAGVVSGIMTRAIIQPLDVLKIRFQLQEEPLRGKLHGKYRGFFQSIKLIYQEEGVTAFWKGHVPAQGHSAIFSLVKFSTFEFLTKEFSAIEQLSTKKKTGDFICGAIAGCAATVFATPLGVIRTRLVAQGEPKVYKNTLHTAKGIWKYEGFSGFFRGFVPAILQVAPFTGLQFLIYHFLSTRWNAHIGHESIGLMVCGASAGTMAKITLYPLDLIRHRLQGN